MPSLRRRILAVGPSAQQRALLGAGMLLIAVSYGLGRYAYGFFVPVFRVEFELDPSLVGMIAAGSYVSYCVTIVLSTLLIPRIGARRVAVTAGVLASAGILVVAFASNAVMLALGVVIAGSSTGMSSPPLADAVARTVAASSRDRVQTVINSSTGIGVALIAPVALVTRDHWQAAWIAFAIACALVTVYVARAVPSAPRTPGPPTRIALLPRPLCPVGSGRLVAAAALLGTASAAVLTFGRDVLVSVGEMDETMSLTAWTLMGIAGTLGVFAGDLARRVGLRRAWLAGMLLIGTATALVGAFPHVDLIAFVAIAAFGAIYMSLSGVLLIWGTRVYPAAPATGVGIAFLVVALGQAVAAPLIGSLTGSFGAHTAFFVAGGAAAVGGWIRPLGRARGDAR